ncbi:MAG: TonB-dependent receptor [Muribaculaceae bacterium]|nr:TonB-dependent receptor [Muribaculaceae bacterium]
MESNSKSTSTLRRMFVAMLLMVAIPAIGFAQKAISGTVTDELGEPLIGVSVTVKGTSVGVSTDLDGKYTVQAREGQTINFSYVGMDPVAVKVGNQSVINVTMQQNAENLDEVVVVGYGKQKKSSITGAVSAIKGDELLAAPSTQLTQMLGGKVAGISSIQTSGEPGVDQASLRIRGSSKAVTYIVDGVPRSIDEIDPNDIASLSVLKDAAATAVYGLNAAGGVIIVTTKKGSEGKPRVTYDGSVGVSMNANFPKFMNGLQFMNYYNMADMMDQLASGQITDRSQYQPKYTQEMFQLVSNGDPTDGYHDYNYIDEVFGTGTTTKHTLSMQGGTDTQNYYASIGYLGQEGNIDNFDYNRYSMRFNLESKLAKYWTLTMGASGFVSDRSQPGYDSGGADNGTYEAGYMSIAKQTIAMHPYLAPKVDDIYTGICSNNLSVPNSPLAAIYESGYKKTNSLDLRSNISLQFDFPWVKGLSAKVTGAYDYANSRNKNLSTPFKVNQYDKVGGTFTVVNGEKGTSVKVGEGSTYSQQLLGQFQLNYDNTFNKVHNVSALALLEMRENKSNSHSAYAKDLDFPELPELGMGTMESIGGWSNKSRMMGYVFRASYNYDSKYFVEFSGRYDGSYKFSGNVSDKRWAFFPSGSVAWRITQESFMESTRSWLDDLKLRASVGLIGDDSGSAAYAFLSTYAFGNKLFLDNTTVNSLYLQYIANPNLTWTKTRSWNWGFDATMWGGKLGIEFDAFYNYTYDILQSLGSNYPPSMGGYHPSYANLGATDARGIDILITHRHKFDVAGKPFNYSIAANLSWAENRWIKYPDAANIPEWQKVTGTSLNATYGWVADGLFRSEEEIDNSAWFGTRPNVGDIKYVDRNGDGKIDWDDRGRIGDGLRPEITFGLNLAAEWNGIDINAQFTGGAKFDVSMTGTYYNGYDDNTIWTQTFKEGGNSPLFLVTNAWNLDNPNGSMPRLTTGNTGHGSDNGLASTFWFRKGDYVRLKSAQIGYTFPKKWMSKAGIEKLRVYVEGSNLFTLDDLPSGFDPESPEVNNGYYPQQRTIMGGLTLTF